MLNLLKKLLIKSESGTQKYRTSCGYLCSTVGIGFNIMLAALKFFAGLVSNSIAITADAANNLSDAGSSLITLLGFKLSSQKPDKQHPYGHGRMEYIAGFIVSILILFMAWPLLSSSVQKIISPESTVFPPAVIMILAFSILVKCYMALYNRGIGKEIDSVALLAASADSLSDCISTGVVLAVTLFSYFSGINIDGYAGILVGLFIGYAGIKSAMDTLNPLLGLPPEKSFVEAIENTALNFDKNILGIHDLLIHDYGPGRKYVSLHAEVPAERNILELHEVIDALEKKIGSEQHCFVTVHMDPIVTSNEEFTEIKRKLQKVLDEINIELAGSETHPGTTKHRHREDFSGISMHDFRMVPGENRTNLIFDMVVPLSCPHSDSELRSFIDSKVKEKMGKKYETVIQVDHDMGMQ